MLERIESTMAAMRSRLANDTIIRNLLTYDGNDALYIKEQYIDNMDQYITLKPIFEFENKKEYDQNSIINIYMTQASPYEEVAKIDGVIQVNIVCNVDVWDLMDNKIRPLQLADRAITLLNNHKFTVSNKLVFNTITDLVISKSMVGYALLFEITDGSDENNNF